MKQDIMGVSFDSVTMDEAVDAGMAFLRDGGFHYVVTPNPEIVNLARRDASYRALLNGAGLVLPDGIGVVYAARILGRPLPGRIPGIDFATGLLARLAQEGGRLYLLGAKPGVAEKAGQNLVNTYPGLVLCGTSDGYFTNPDAVAEKVRAAQPDVAFVCLGAPKQERWMVEYGPQTGTHLMLGLGGALDVFAGEVQRAPERWQKAGFEWLYRLIHQPSRLGRILKLPLFLFAAVGARLRSGSGGAS